MAPKSNSDARSDGVQQQLKTRRNGDADKEDYGKVSQCKCDRKKTFLGYRSRGFSGAAFSFDDNAPAES